MLFSAETSVQADTTKTTESIRSEMERTTNMILIVSEKLILLSTTMFDDVGQDSTARQ